MVEKEQPGPPRTILALLAANGKAKQEAFKKEKLRGSPTQSTQKEVNDAVILFRATQSLLSRLGFNDLPLPGHEQVVFASPPDETGALRQQLSREVSKKESLAKHNLRLQAAYEEAVLTKDIAEKRVGVLEDELTIAEEKTTKSHRKSDNLLNELNAEKGGREKDGVAAQHSLAQVEQERDAALKQNAALVVENTELKVQNRTSSGGEATLVAAEKRIVELEEQLTTTNIARRTAEKRNTTLQTRNATLRQDLRDEKRKKILDAKEAARREKQLEGERAAARGQNTTLRQALRDEKGGRAQDRKKATRREKSNKDSLSASKGKINELSTQLIGVTRERDTSLEENGILKAQLSTERELRVGAQERALHLEEELLVAEETIRSLREEVSIAKSSRDDALSTLASEREKVQLRLLTSLNTSGEVAAIKGKEIRQWDQVDKQWMQVTLHHDEGDQLRRGLIYLIAASDLSTRDFIKRSGILDTSTIPTLKSGKKMPRLSTIKKVIEASPLPQGSRTAQYLYVLWNKGNLMSVEDLADASAGDIVSYIKMLHGDSRENVANAFRKTETSISDWIRNKSQPYVDGQDVKHWVGANNPALIEILLHKIEKSSQRIPAETLQAVLSEEYLFAEHRELLGSFALSAGEESLLGRAREFTAGLKAQGESKLYGKLLRFIRMEQGMQLKTLGPTAEGNENSRFLPTDISVMHQARTLGFSLPNPIACLLLDVVTDERGTTGE